LVIKRTTCGYSWTAVSKTGSSGWAHATRSRTVLTSTIRMLDTNGKLAFLQKSKFVFRPWNRHLTLYDSGGEFELVKVSGSTSAAPPEPALSP
jgi:hypothetical protein